MTASKADGKNESLLPHERFLQLVGLRHRRSQQSISLADPVARKGAVEDRKKVLFSSNDIQRRERDKTVLEMNGIALDIKSYRSHTTVAKAPQHA